VDVLLHIEQAHCRLVRKQLGASGDCGEQPGAAVAQSLKLCLASLLWNRLLRASAVAVAGVRNIVFT
jgi:hypothetical protein